MAAAEAIPRTYFTLRREHCISSSWFRVLYTFRETSPVTNYRNDPWKYSQPPAPGRCRVCASCELCTEGDTVSPPLGHFFFYWEKKQEELLQYSFQMLSLTNSFEHFHWKCNLTFLKIKLNLHNTEWQPITTMPGGVCCTDGLKPPSPESCTGKGGSLPLLLRT